MWRIVQGERRADKEARQKWEAENAEALRQQRRQALLEEQQFRDLNAAEEAQAAQDEQDAIDAQAAADAAAAQEAEDDIPLPVAQPARQPLVGTPSL